jgi:hypothetical protein
MESETLAALMFPLLFLFVFMGIPVAFALIATAFVMALPVFGDLASLQIYNQIQNTASQLLLTAVPAFVFMGVMLEASGISERLFRAMQIWMGRLPGGLSLATMTMAAIIAASTGIVGAVEVVIGVMAIPIMMRYGYDKSLISGTICAGGSLGTMIPPSIVVVIYAAIAQESVGKLFAAVLFPALIMVVLFLGYLFQSQDEPASGAAGRRGRAGLLHPETLDHSDRHRACRLSDRRGLRRDPLGCGHAHGGRIRRRLGGGFSDDRLQPPHLGGDDRHLGTNPQDHLYDPADRGGRKHVCRDLQAAPRQCAGAGYRLLLRPIGLGDHRRSAADRVHRRVHSGLGVGGVDHLADLPADPVSVRH